MLARMVRFILFVLCIAVAASASADDVATLVQQLDSAVFTERETATAKLIEVGLPAVEPVSANLSRQSLEVTLRSIHILRELALVGDQATADAAQQALERASENGSTAVRRRAESALITLAETRQTKMIEVLQKLGAKFTAATTAWGIPVDGDATEVEIGPDWRGEDKDFRRLRWLSDIKRLTLVGPQVSDDWIRLARDMKHVTDLRIKRAKITDAGMAMLRDFPNLQRVAVMYTPITDASIDHLLAVTNLQMLVAYGTNITPDGVKKLNDENPAAKVDFRRGAFLGIGGQPSSLGYHIGRVQDNSAAAAAGVEIDDVLVKYNDARIQTFEELTAQIAKHKSGEEVKLTVARDVDVRPAILQRAAIANLGMQGQAHALGCEITEITPKSPAALAGFRKGDILVTVGDKRVVDWASFTKAMDDLDKELDSARIEFVRSARVVVLNAKLGEWE